MALIIADRIKETSTATGTGALTLAGAVTGFRAFSAVCTSPSDTCYYVIDDGAGNWEVGLGTYSAANTLTRTTVLASSNAGAAVSFSAGTKQVWLDLAAAQIAGLQNDIFGAEISITGAATATIGRMHVCSGTTADYTVTLPPVAGNAGKSLSLRMAAGLTKLVTIDGNGAETIDGAATRIMWTNEVATLYCDGVTWTKIAGKSIPMYATMRLQSGTPGTAQTISNSTQTKVLVNQIDSSVMGLANTANNRIDIKRPGTYAVAGTAYCTTGFSYSRVICILQKNAGNIFTGETSAGSTSYPWCQAEGRPVLAAGDYIELNVLQVSGSSSYLYGDPTAASNILSVMEIPTW